MATALQFVPTLLLSSPAGSLADRVSLWQLDVLIVVFGAATAFDTPTRLAFVGLRRRLLYPPAT